MKIVITGSGQLAWELHRTAPQGVEVVGLARKDLDISNAEQVATKLREIKPDVVINAAAYTAVDKAEAEKSVAHAVNASGPEHIATLCDEIGAYFLHVSTDFVFDGENCRPYLADDDVKPLGVYGETKAAGEQAIAKRMSTNWAVIRTAWVYSTHGNNFVKTMLRLMVDKPQLGVVGDQIGTPTWAKGLALACWSAVNHRIAGVFHWTDIGVASWYDFAVAIQRVGLELGMLEKAIPIASIATQDYPTPATRPSYSVLDKKKLLDALPDITGIHWQAQLEHMMAELNDHHE